MYEYTVVSYSTVQCIMHYLASVFGMIDYILTYDKHVDFLMVLLSLTQTPMFLLLGKEIGFLSIGEGG